MKVNKNEYVFIFLFSVSKSVITPEQTIKIPATHVETVVDTTAAGDSFNGAYFSVRLKGGRVIDAAEAGCKLAAQVTQHSGAIVPTSPA